MWAVGQKMKISFISYRNTHSKQGLAGICPPSFRCTSVWILVFHFKWCGSLFTALPSCLSSFICSSFWIMENDFFQATWHGRNKRLFQSGVSWKYGYFTSHDAFQFLTYLFCFKFASSNWWKFQIIIQCVLTHLLSRKVSLH